MEFFLDTSAVFKLFVEEDQSDIYMDLVQSDPSVHVSHISWVEFHSALNRRMPQKGLTLRQHHHVLEEFHKEWKGYSKIKVSEKILTSAAQLVIKHNLRTLDSIQLASALEVSFLLEEPLAFLTADHRLEAAARREKLTTRI